MTFWTRWVWMLLIATAASGRYTKAKTADTHFMTLGSTYNYIYQTSAVLNEPQGEPGGQSLKDVGFNIEMDVAIAPIWQHPRNDEEQLIQMMTSSSMLSVKARKGPTPEGFVKKNSRLNKYSDYPIFLHRRDGAVVGVYIVTGDDLTLINIKKGIASLLQFQKKTVKKRELDASGLCEVTYSYEGGVLAKSKQHCTTAPGTQFYNSTNKVLSANVEHDASITYKFSKDEEQVPSLITGTEIHTLRVQARLETGSQVASRQFLNLKGSTGKNKSKYTGKNVADVIKSIAKKLKKQLEEQSLQTVPNPKECISCKSLSDLIFNFSAALRSSNLATQSSGIAFIRILQKMRESDQQTIQSILTNSRVKTILPQVLDIVAATQTDAGHRAALAVLDFKAESSIDLQERYLIALSLSTHPSEALINDLFKLLKSQIPNQKLRETLLLAIATLAETYQTSRGEKKETKVLTDIAKYIKVKLEKCKNEDCKLPYIRALKNLRNKTFTTTLLKLASGAERKAAIYAMRALQTMPSSFIDNKIKLSLERVFLELDAPHDSTVRSLAFNILLEHDPTEDFLSTVFRRMENQKFKEMNTLVLSQIRDAMENNGQMKKRVTKVLKGNQYGNYHILGQNGLSTAFSRVLAQDKHANSTFSNILEINGGLLKRSTVDVFVNSDEAFLRLLSFEIFAGGLNMFGGEEDAGADVEEATAGIEVTLMNSQLRPYVFFTGQGELMGHVWSGTGSERTTALQGSVLLHDHKQYVPLQNGLTLEVVLTGVVSYDFAGQVEISLWNRNAHSLVEVAAAVVVQGQTRLDNSLVQTMLEFNSGAQSQLNFVSDLDFSDDITMCMQMTQPDFEIVENVRKLERIPGSKYMLRKYKRKVIQSPGKTYVMNRKNTQLCNKMFS